jgi:hypothetical protein
MQTEKDSTNRILWRGNRGLLVRLPPTLTSIPSQLEFLRLLPQSPSINNQTNSLIRAPVNNPTRKLSGPTNRFFAIFRVLSRFFAIIFRGPPLPCHKSPVPFPSLLSGTLGHNQTHSYCAYSVDRRSWFSILHFNEAPSAPDIWMKKQCSAVFKNKTIGTINLAGGYTFSGTNSRVSFSHKSCEPDKERTEACAWRWRGCRKAFCLNIKLICA